MAKLKRNDYLIAAVIAAIIPALLMLDVLSNETEQIFSFLLFPGAIIAMVIGGGVHRAGHIAIFFGFWLWCYFLILLVFYFAGKWGSRKNASNN